ncbi:MAG TPA: tRNA(His) guanylyltransferase Thg1 family protein [Polyangia bacterium]|nr:tRNA(His) guanylyltransferase Thg1 family protein [Polyangia bacterium]
MRREGFAEHLEHFEVLADRELMAGFPTVARLQVRDLEVLLAAPENGFAQPFDVRFGKMMVKTASHLLAAGTGVIYGFAEPGEISVLIAPAPEEEEARDARELLIRLVSEASAKLSLLLGGIAAFEGRLYELPNPQLALEYFRWRQEQARLRTLDRYCGYILAKGRAPGADTLQVLADMAEDEKVEIMRNSEIDFEGLPNWQRRGAGIYVRRPNGAAPGEGPRLVVDPNLPLAEAYTEYLKRFFARA